VPGDRPPRQIDWSTVGALAVRELRIVLRGRDWARTLVRSVALVTGLALLLVLQPNALASARGPGVLTGFNFWLILTAFSTIWSVGALAGRRVQAEMPGGVLDELLLAGCSPASVLVAKGLAHSAITVLLVAAYLPAALLITAVKGLPAIHALLVALTVGAGAGLGLLGGLSSVLQGTQLVFRISGTLWLLGSTARVAVNPSAFASPVGKMVASILFFNPFGVLISTLDSRLRGWQEGMVIWFLYLAVGVYGLVRGAAKEWSLQPKLPTPVLSIKSVSWWRPGAAVANHNTRWADFIRRMSQRSDSRDAIAWLSLRTTPQICVGAGVLLPTFFLIPKGFPPDLGELFRACAVYLLWTTCALVAHHAAEALAKDRAQGRWLNIALIPVSNRELLVAKLLPAFRSVQALWLLALIALTIAAAFPPSILTKSEWYFCTLVAIGTLPLVYALLGALIGLWAPSPAEGQWQIGVWITALPYTVLILNIFTGRVPLLFAISPLSGLIRYVKDTTIVQGMWAGIVLYALVGVFIWWMLSLQLRRWALRE
jgi:hypothetical protein